jgi:hypothetical protein
VFQKIRAWWTNRKRRQQEKYAEDHAYVDPAEVERAERNFDVGSRHEGGGR